MSSSNIIKLHTLRPTVVTIGPGDRCSNRPFDRETLGNEDAGEPISPTIALSEAAQIVAQARSEAEALVATASAMAEELKQEAFEKGFEKGYAEGVQAARTALEEQIGCIAGLANSAMIEWASLLRSAEAELVQLALAVAEKAVHRRLAEDETFVVALVKGALEYVDILDVVRIRVNPKDLEILQAHWDELGLSWPGQSIELTSDPKVQLGGCIVDTKEAVMDAQLETRLAEIEMAFRSELDTDRKR